MSKWPNALLDEIAEAWADEWERWLYRDATWLPENKGRSGHEVCRLDDSGYAGEFSEVHRYKRADTAENALLVLRDRACARRVLAVATEEGATQQSTVSGAVSGAGGEGGLNRTGLSD